MTEDEMAVCHAPPWKPLWSRRGGARGVRPGPLSLIYGSAENRLGKLWELVMDREAWRAPGVLPTSTRGSR